WTEISRPGVYRGQCAELCGKDHGFMPIVVKAVPRAEFRDWLAAQKAATAPQAAEDTGAASRNATQYATNSRRGKAMSTQYEATADHHDHKPGFVDRWFFSTNHKDIGTLYLLFSFIMVIIGAAFSVGIRAELTTPGLQLFDPQTFNQLTTMHAL